MSPSPIRKVFNLLKDMVGGFGNEVISTEMPPPPSYESIDHDPSSYKLIPQSRFPLRLYNPSQPPRIVATDVPQWNWSTTECKEWLVAVLMDLMDWDALAAARQADHLHGHGPNLYLRTSESWIALLGVDNGKGIYAMLVGCRRRKGAVPQGVRIWHGVGQ
ncbi:uncharacterized protein RCO7_05448 [Rhynchosporium graminicola]|uniref:Uncharacterized protein n=1 Tax=Rhynchosporium graminicola TaxID=2792576 RepID=A0A1E1KV25_9HELO|nr:uncharacterized protein RCO7_05448 [Rhynchosporium commune]